MGYKYFKKISYFSLGCKPYAFITTTDDEGSSYNDNKWHTCEIRRVGVNGSIIVDEKWQGILLSTHSKMKYFLFYLEVDILAMPNKKVAFKIILFYIEHKIFF